MFTLDNSYIEEKKKKKPCVMKGDHFQAPCRAAVMLFLQQDCVIILCKPMSTHIEENISLDIWPHHNISLTLFARLNVFGGGGGLHSYTLKDYLITNSTFNVQ